MMATSCAFVFLATMVSNFCCIQEETEVPQLREIKGQVVDVNGDPISGAEVRGYLSSSVPGSDAPWFKIAKWKTKSDDDGKFKVLVAKDVPAGHRRHVGVTAGSKVHYESSNYVDGDRLEKEEVTLDPLELKRGVLVRGRLVAPSGLEKPLNPTITIFFEKSLASKPQHVSFYRELNCDKDGKFKFLAPGDIECKVTVNADNYLPNTKLQKVVSKSLQSDEDVPEIDWGNMKLESGVSVYGTATLKNGKPAVGIVVAILQWAKKDTDRVYDFVSSVKTDRDGKYRLPPHDGKCSILVLKACRGQKIVDGAVEVLRTDGELPIFDSVEMDLTGKGHEFNHDLQEADWVVFGGTVKEMSGKPVSGVSLEFGWETEFGNLETQYLRTDGDGKYELRLAKGRKPVLRFHNVLIGNDTYDPVIPKATAMRFPNLFSSKIAAVLVKPKFNPVDSDVTDLNWVLMSDSPGVSTAVGRVGEALRGWILDE